MKPKTTLYVSGFLKKLRARKSYLDNSRGPPFQKSRKYYSKRSGKIIVKGVLKMKKRQFLTMWTIIISVLFIFSGYLCAQFEGSYALFVVADGITPNAAETVIAERLEGLGFDVTISGQDEVTDDSIEDMSLLLISATVSSGTVGGNMPGLADYPIPVINWEPFLYDAQGFQEVDGGEFNTTLIEIVNEEHPLAAGLFEGLVEITTVEKAVSYGTPQGEAEIIAVNSNTDSSHQVVLFGYDTGATMAVGTAPARRVGTFLLNDVADAMTDEGWMLFDASVYWAMGVEQTAVKNSNPDIPTRYMLRDNYPNPFNPITNIAFSIPKQTHVRLSIWNTLGEKVVVLLDEIRPAGDQTVTFHATNMPSGLYFYRLEAASHTITRKMLFMK
jgi:hypothetical protein